MDNTTIFERLKTSPFRQKFKLSDKDLAYIEDKGIDVIRRHAADFIKTRLAPAFIINDGKQTPMRGHPVFIAQHATATCCRGCLYKWHRIAAGQELSQEQQQYVADIIMAWIERQIEKRL